MSTRRTRNKPKAPDYEEVSTRRMKDIKKCVFGNNAKRVHKHRLRKKTAGCHISDGAREKIVRAKIEEALKDADSSRPLFVLKTSKMPCAGKGVFVSDEHVMAPIGTIIPYAGVLVEGITPEVSQSQYVVEIKENTYLVGNRRYVSGQPLGCFINRVMSPKVWKSTELTRMREEDPGIQKFTEKNAKLHVIENTAYFELIKNLASGQEVLTTYGKSFKIYKPI